MCDHTEYLAHCLDCVVGDDARVTELEVDSLGVCTEARARYGDGSSAVLVREADGWRFVGHYYTDAATQTGMYDP